jgi:hypothetical protein
VIQRFALQLQTHAAPDHGTSTICSDQILCPHRAFPTFRFDLGDNREFRVPRLIDLHIDELCIPLDASLRVSVKICFQDPFNPALMNGDFVWESRGDSNILNDGRSLNDFLLVVGRVPKRDLRQMVSDSRVDRQLTANIPATSDNPL